MVPGFPTVATGHVPSNGRDSPSLVPRRVVQSTCSYSYKFGNMDVDEDEDDDEDKDDEEDDDANVDDDDKMVSMEGVSSLFRSYSFIVVVDVIVVRGTSTVSTSVAETGTASTETDTASGQVSHSLHSIFFALEQVSIDLRTRALHMVTKHASSYNVFNLTPSVGA